MTQQTFKSAGRRYWRAFVPLMAIYMLIVLGGSYYLKIIDPEPRWLQVALGVATALPLLGFFAVMLRYFAETDEYHRQIHLKGFAYGAAITISAVTVVGSLQMFDAIGYVELFWFNPMFFITYGLSTYALGGRQCL